MSFKQKTLKLTAMMLNEEIKEKVKWITEQSFWSDTNFIIKNDIRVIIHSDGDLNIFGDNYNDDKNNNNIWKKKNINEYNQLCRESRISFICTKSAGLLSYIFVDVGEEYRFSVISDKAVKKAIHSINLTQQFVTHDEDESEDEDSDDDDDDRKNNNSIDHQQDKKRTILRLTVADKNHQFFPPTKIRLKNLVLSSVELKSENTHYHHFLDSSIPKDLSSTQPLQSIDPHVIVRYHSLLSYFILF
jgi:hypothetical protein